MTPDELEFVGAGDAVRASLRAPANASMMLEDADGGPVTVSNAAIKDNVAQVSTTSTLAASVQTVAADSSAGAFTLTLPAASAVSGRHMHILDAGGVAGTNNITVAAAGTDTINGQTTLVMNSNHAAVSLCAYFTNSVGKWFATF